MRYIIGVLLGLSALCGQAEAQTVVKVCASGCNYALDQLQQAVDDAQPGWIIEIQAGQTSNPLIGLRLRDKGVADGPYITIRSSAMSELPWGKRVTPADKPKMATIINGFPGYNVIYGERSAGFYRFEGIEFTVRPNEGQINMIEFGTISNGQIVDTQPSQLAHDIVFDRCYFHGVPRTNGPTRAVLANMGRLEIQNSWFEDIKNRDADSTTVGGWNSIGPFYFRNNHLSASGITTIFGGAVPVIKGVRATGLFYIGNHYYRPWTWRSQAGLSNPTGVCLYDGNGGEYFRNLTNNTFWQCDHGIWGVISSAQWDAGFYDKNHFELKNSDQTLVEGNLFENGWLPGGGQQHGAAFLFNQVDNEFGTGDPTATVTNTELRYNVIRHTPWGVSMGLIGTYEIPMHDIDFHDNLFYKLSEEPESLGDGVLLQTTTTGALQFRQNTTIMNRTSGGFAVSLANAPTDMVSFYGNVLGFNGFGFYNSVSGAGNLWNAVDTAWNTNRMFSRNVIVNNQNISIFGDIYPRINVGRNADTGRTNCLGCAFPANWSDVQFENFDAFDYRLRIGGPFKKWSHFGRDVGADMDVVNWSTKNAVDGEYNPFFDFLIRDLAPGQNSMDLSYVAYDQQSCRLSVSDRFDYSTSVYDAPDAGGDQARSVTVAGLTPNTRYFYQVLCGTEGYRRSGVFLTLP